MEYLALAPLPLLLLFPWGRRSLWWLLVTAPLAILALMLASEPDLGD